MILYAVFGYALVFHGFSAQAEVCGGNLQADNGTLEIEPSGWPCLWVISLQNRTGLQLELSPSMEEPILVIPEQKNFSSLDHVESFWLKGSEKVSHTFEGKVLAVLVPSHYEQIILTWTGLTVGHSPVTLSRKFVNASEGSLDWEHKTDGTDKVFWAFDHRTHGNLKWTLDTVLPACDVEGSCDSISFAVLQIMLDGNISIIEKAWTCEGSSEGSLNLTNTAKLLVILNINSVVAARTNLQVTWKQNQERANVQLGYFFYPGSGFIKFANRFYVGNTIKISLRIKPINPSGLILAVHGTKDYIVLQMLNGTVKFTAENGNGPFSSTFTPAGTLDLCNGKWHTIEATKTENMVTLGVDGQFATAGLGSLLCTASDSEHPFYLGGQPNSSAVGVETNEQFVGCIEDLLVQGRKAFEFPSYYESTHGGVPVQRCPVDYTEVEANVEIQATTLKEFVTIEDCQEPIAQSPATRTIVALEGDAVEMQCVVHGIPLPNITWTRQYGTLASDRVENDGKVLRIKNAQLNDKGSYVCVAANGVGTPATQLVRLHLYNPSEECSRIIESDKGNLAIKSLSSGCLWLIKLQNTTGFRVELDPRMTEPVSFISEPNCFKSNVQSIQLTGSKNTTHLFEGKSLAIVVPPGRERRTLSWTGLDVDDSGVSSSTKFVYDLKGTLEWDNQRDRTDKIFWAIDLESSGELKWTLNTASTAREQDENPREDISFSVLRISPGGTISDVRRTCDDSSEGSLKLEISSQVLILLHMKSLGTSRSKLEVSWTHHNEPVEKNLGGILAGTCGTELVVIPFNSGQTKVIQSYCIFGLTFDWNSRRIYYLQYRVGIMRSNLDGSDSEILSSETVESWTRFHGMTIEPASGNLYYGHLSSRTIRVCDNNVKKCSTIVNNVSSVRDFAVHLSKGLLFWSTYDNEIFRASLDGSNAKVLLRRNVLGLDVDEHEDRLYWGFYGGIGSCDIKGRHIRELPKRNITGPINDVAIDNDKVYIGSWNSDGVHVMSKLGTNSRKLANAQFKNNVEFIAFFGTRVSNRPRNPCAEANCAHLCVLVTRWTYRCTCPDGQVLNADGKTCNISCLQFPCLTWAL